jgi:hypothetical protein
VITTRIATKVANRSVGMAMDRWCESVETLRHHRAILSRIAGKIANRSIAQAFDKWRLGAGCARRDAHLVYVLALRRRAHVKSEAFWQWCFVTAEKKLQRAQVQISKPLVDP